jgi:hypothetical protein
VEWNYGEYEGLNGQHFLLDTGTLNVLAYYRAIPSVKIRNGSLVSG